MAGGTGDGAQGEGVGGGGMSGCCSLLHLLPARLTSKTKSLPSHSTWRVRGT